MGGKTSKRRNSKENARKRYAKNAKTAKNAKNAKKNTYARVKRVYPKNHKFNSTYNRGARVLKVHRSMRHH